MTATMCLLWEQSLIDCYKIQKRFLEISMSFQYLRSIILYKFCAVFCSYGFSTLVQTYSFSLIVCLVVVPTFKGTLI